MLNSIDSFNKLDALVKRDKISFYSLAKKLGIPTSFFSEWKKGKMMPKVDKLQKIAKYFGVPVEYFLEDISVKGE